MFHLNNEQAKNFAKLINCCVFLIARTSPFVLWLDWRRLQTLQNVIFERGSKSVLWWSQKREQHKESLRLRIDCPFMNLSIAFAYLCKANEKEEHRKAVPPEGRRHHSSVQGGTTTQRCNLFWSSKIIYGAICLIGHPIKCTDIAW